MLPSPLPEETTSVSSTKSGHSTQHSRRTGASSQRGGDHLPLQPGAHGAVILKTTARFLMKSHLFQWFYRTDLQKGLVVYKHTGETLEHSSIWILVCEPQFHSREELTTKQDAQQKTRSFVTLRRRRGEETLTCSSCNSHRRAWVNITPLLFAFLSSLSRKQDAQVA